MTALTELERSTGLNEPLFPAWPQLAPGALFGLTGEIVTSATANSEADPAAVLATFLTHAGISVGRGPYVRVGDDEHHARLFNVLVGQSARGRKGTSEGPVRRIGERAARSIEPLNWSPGPMSSGEGLIDVIRDADEGGTGGVADKRLLIVEGEFGAPLRAMQRQGNTLSTVIRSAWDGKTLEPLVKNGRIRASDPHIGIMGHITKPELKTLLRQVEIFNGFANRFLWWCTRRSKRIPLARGMEDADVVRLGDEYAQRLRYTKKLGEVKFTADARAHYEALYEDLSADHDGIYGVVIARSEVQVIRLALTYALIEASPRITIDHLAAALSVLDYCQASAKFLFWDASASTLESRILLALADEPLDQTQLHSKFGRHAKGEDLNTALQNLQTQGRIDCDRYPTRGRSRSVWQLRKDIDDAKKAEKAKKGELGVVSSLNSLFFAGGRVPRQSGSFLTQ